MTHIALTLSGLLLYSSKVSTLPPGTPGGCKDTKYCCTGFYELNDKCHECVGSYGENCTNPCPSGSFGPRCRKSCTCKDEKCDKVFGCPEEKLTTFNGLLLFLLKAKTVKDIITSRSSPGNLTISHHTNMSKDESFENISNDIWGYIMNLIKTWMPWFIIFVIVICLCIFGICIIKCRKERIKKEMQQSNRIHINHMFEEQPDNNGNVYTDMLNENMSVYADINTTVDETSEKEYMHRTHVFEGQTESHVYCGLNVYTEMSGIQSNTYIDILPEPENTDECGYMYFNDLFEEQSDSHEYHNMNEQISKDLPHNKDSELNAHGSTEHVYMHI